MFKYFIKNNSNSDPSCDFGFFTEVRGLFYEYINQKLVGTQPNPPHMLLWACISFFKIGVLYTSEYWMSQKYSRANNKLLYFVIANCPCLKCLLFKLLENKLQHYLLLREFQKKFYIEVFLQIKFICLSLLLNWPIGKL